ncbi:MAG TPA: glycosyltransferase family 4 protein [Nocardioidaceae bacterium]|nr:glycosyltransferase family 4 protein [Nocardioidaceae bacterium]
MKIRILQHDLYGEGGGVLTVSLGLSEELARRGHEVELVSIRRPRAPSVHRLPTNVAVTSLTRTIPAHLRNGRRTWLRRWLMRQPSRIMPKREPRYDHYSLYTDLVLARYLWSVRDGAVISMQPGLNVALARLGRKRYVRVAQDHRPYVSRAGGIIRAYQRYAARLDAFLVLTEQDTRRYNEVLGHDVTVRTMTNSTPEYTGELSDQQHKVVVAAGRLSRSKGFDLLVDAWSQVAARHPDWQLRIYGEGSRRPDLEEQIRRLELQSSVRLMGFSTQLQAEMAASSVFVLSSRVEGYGMVLVEAMSCGVPVVSFDCPTGPRDIITHEVDGLLVPHRDVDGMAEAIIRMIELGPEGRLKLGAAARESAQQRSPSVVVTRWEELLEGLLAGKAR